jgi:hypothetical protein
MLKLYLFIHIIDKFPIENAWFNLQDQGDVLFPRSPFEDLHWRISEAEPSSSASLEPLQSTDEMIFDIQLTRENTIPL